MPQKFSKGDGMLLSRVRSSRDDHRGLMMRDSSREEVLSAIESQVREFLVAAGCGHPPVDAIQIAEHHLRMELDSLKAPRGSAGRRVDLRRETNEEKRQWFVALAVAEYLKALVLERLDMTAAELRSMTGESLTNLLAVNLLVPSVWFTTDAPALDFDLPDLKGRYRTATHETLAWRMLDLPSPCVISIIDHGRVLRRRSNAWRITRTLSAVEKECQQFVHRYSRPKLMQREGWTVQGWPVHVGSTKREVLRSVFEEW